MFKAILQISIIVFALFQALSAAALSAEYYATSTALANGYWVKVAVDTTGVYSISADRLREWGFSNPDRVAVFGYGSVNCVDNTFSESRPDDLKRLACLNDGNRLLFYAEGDTRVTVNSAKTATFERNFYDFNSYYFLTEIEAPVDLPSQIHYSANSDATPLTSSYAVAAIEHELQNPCIGGAIWHGHIQEAGEAHTFTFELEDYCSVPSGNYEINVGYIYAAECSSTSDNRTHPTITVHGDWTESGSSRPNMSVHNANALYTHNNGSFKLVGSGSERTLSFDIAPAAEFEGDYFAIDKVWAIYPCSNKIGKKGWRKLNISAGTYSTFGVLDAPSDLILWDITDVRAVSSLEFVVDGTTATAAIPTGSGMHRILVFSPSAITSEPQFVEVVEPQNLHGMEVPEMLIVSTESLKDKAEELANIHRNIQGLDVAIVTQEQVFNEFSSGARTPLAIKRLAKMLYDRNPDKLRYLLLYGPSISDNRFINHPREDVLVSFQAERVADSRSNTSNYCADLYFGMLADGYNHTQIDKQPVLISVGRLPIHNMAQADAYNGKIADYLQNPPIAAALRGVFLSDDGDDDSHFIHSRQALDLLKDERPLMALTGIDLAVYPFPKSSIEAVDARTKVRESLMRGQTYFWYTGHGGTNYLTATNKLWSRYYVNETHNRVPYFAMLATCETFEFDNNSGGLAETMLFNGTGGAVGLIASGRAVYLDYNRQLNHAVATTLGQATAGMTWADVFRIARESILSSNSTSSGVGINMLCYNFGGDPALPLPIPTDEIEFTSIADANFNNEEPSVSALAPIVVKGRVAAAEGYPAFNGIGSLEVYAASYNNPVINSSLSAGEITLSEVPVDTVLLAEFPIEVDDGAFEVSVTLPEVSKNEANRIMVVARDGSRLAVGSANITIADASDEIVSGAPEIVKAYVGSEDFINGDIVPAQTTFTAVVRPGTSGISTSNCFIGSAPRLMLNGNVNLSTQMNMYYDVDGNLVINCMLPKLTDGQHSIDLSVKSLSGEYADAKIDFIVSSSPLDLNVTIGGVKTVRTALEVDFECEQTLSEYTLFIADAAGKVVFTESSPEFPYRWDLNANDGSTVNDGVYDVWVMGRKQSSYGASPKVNFTVVKE